jgi:hypothetical protein
VLDLLLGRRQEMNECICATKPDFVQSHVLVHRMQLRPLVITIGIHVTTDERSGRKCISPAAFTLASYSST